MSESDPLRVLTTAPDGVTAAMIKGLLESGGVPVMLRNANSSLWLYPSGPSSLGPVDVLVPESSLEEAQRLLEEDASGSADDDVVNI